MRTAKKTLGIRIGTLSWRNQASLLWNFVENASIPTFLASARGTLVYANRAFCSATNWRRWPATVGRNIRFGRSNSPSAQAPTKPMLGMTKPRNDKALDNHLSRHQRRGWYEHRTDDVRALSVILSDSG
jgi:hypothetical protein